MLLLLEPVEVLIVHSGMSLHGWRHSRELGHIGDVVPSASCNLSHLLRHPDHPFLHSSLPAALVPFAWHLCCLLLFLFIRCNIGLFLVGSLRALVNAHFGDRFSRPRCLIPIYLWNIIGFTQFRDQGWEERGQR